MPIFAFANAGVSLEGLSFNSLFESVPLGIVCGLFFGKQIGVFLFSIVSIKLKLAAMPNNSNILSFYGVGVLTGIGFTIGLFVGNLAFVNDTEYMDGVKIGVLVGSFFIYNFKFILIYFLKKMIDDKIIKLASDTKNYGLKNYFTHHSNSKNHICGDKIKIQLVAKKKK